MKLSTAAYTLGLVTTVFPPRSTRLFPLVAAKTNAATAPPPIRANSHHAEPPFLLSSSSLWGAVDALLPAVSSETVPFGSATLTLPFELKTVIVPFDRSLLIPLASNEIVRAEFGAILTVPIDPTLTVADAEPDVEIVLDVKMERPLITCSPFTSTTGAFPSTAVPETTISPASLSLPANATIEYVAVIATIRQKDSALLSILPILIISPLLPKLDMYFKYNHLKLLHKMFADVNKIGTNTKKADLSPSGLNCIEGCGSFQRLYHKGASLNKPF
jgi:hypothetical protein